MYEYAPRFQKKKEKLLTLDVLIIGLAVYFLSYVPGILYPAALQTAGFAGLGVAILLYSMLLSRRYAYSLEETEAGKVDFIITEYYGKRATVVCRVARDSVREVILRTGETKKKIAEEQRAKSRYSYTGVLFDEERYYLCIEEAGERFVVEICASNDLLEHLSVYL